MDIMESKLPIALVFLLSLFDLRASSFLIVNQPSESVKLSPNSMVSVPMFNEFDNESGVGTGGPVVVSRTPESKSHSTCQLEQVIHLLHQPGCQPKAIASAACAGSCPSYVQTSTSKYWQHERSCTCCQQIGWKEATFTLECPSSDPPFKKIKTFAPTECICRSCTDLGREDLRPQELVEAFNEETAERTKTS